MAEEDIKLSMLPDDNDNRANGIEDDDNGDVDGQGTDKTKDKPKIGSSNSSAAGKRNLFFKDGKRKIDFILAWSVGEKAAENGKNARSVFEEALVAEGLQLEYDEERAGDIRYAKVQAPYAVLKRYADILKMRLPMKTALADHRITDRYEDWQNPIKPVSFTLWNRTTELFKRFLTPFQYDHTIVPKTKRPYTCPYSSAKEYLFNIPVQKEDLFPQSIRSWIVDYILRRKPYAKDKDNFCYGIHKMISDGFYMAAYPLHEGHWKKGSAENNRKILFDHWANWKNGFKFQPLDFIKTYFGEKIGLYFAWLGFYTKMLVPASLVGVIVFIYGLSIMSSNTVTKELCASENITMCPLCDGQCHYWKLSAACSHAKASRIFDNGSTVVFAIFMSLWGTLFLEFWKRKQATIQYKWDLTSFVSEEEPPRPEYLSKMEGWHTMKVNTITGIKEPYLPFWRKRFPIFVCSYSIMLLLAAVAVGAVVGVIAYRVSVLGALQLLTKSNFESNYTIVTDSADIIYKNASLVTTVTAAIINLLIIIILNMIYSRLAFWLTDWECLRTQSEYDNSITIKLFALQFVNYFSSIVYIAFFKGLFVGRPGKYRRIFGGRQEECEAGGCLIELCIQLAIIMVGKQLIQNNIIEIVIPWIIKKVKSFCDKETREQKLAKTAWEKDYLLQPAISLSLFHEYLEMALQFGFLTIFCAAFPLAPLFALLNNIMEIRLDASKFTTVLRRPTAERAASIGVWYSVLYGISRIAIISNAFIIALTSEFIPRMVYMLRYSDNESLEGYVNFTLAYFNTEDFNKGEMPNDAIPGQVPVCRYKDFRNPPWEDPNYKRSEVFWHILAARLAFVCIFENFVVVLTSLVAWLIPDVPRELKEQIRREAYVTNEIILKTELRRAHGEDVSDVVLDRLAHMEHERYSPRHSEDEEVGFSPDKQPNAKTKL